MSKLTATWMGTFESLRDYTNIPRITLKSLLDYAIDGRRGGHFLDAVLSNDLAKSFQHGDLSNLATLWATATFVYNRMPSDCWGNKQKVEDWKGLRKTMVQVMSSEDVEKVVSDWLVEASRDVS